MKIKLALFVVVALGLALHAAYEYFARGDEQFIPFAGIAITTGLMWLVALGTGRSSRQLDSNA